jgi:hypothetical protein
VLSFEGADGARANGCHGQGLEVDNVVSTRAIKLFCLVLTEQLQRRSGGVPVLLGSCAGPRRKCEDKTAKGAAESVLEYRGTS